MTREECKQLIMVIEATFPSSSNISPQEKLNAWFYILEEYDYQQMLMALKIFINSGSSAFAPSVSQLIAMSRKPSELTEKLSEPKYDEVTVWREVRQAIKNGIYHAEEEFKKLSPIAQRMVGDSQQLHEWAQVESEVIDSVIQSNFKARFKDFQIAEATKAKRNREIAQMPREVQALIQKSSAAIGVNDDL